MSQGEELLDLHGDIASRPSFELALRGYDKRQVDHYVSQTASEISKLAAEREHAFGRLQNLAAQFQHLQAELTELRQQPPQVDRASFHHLGPMVDQILALSEKQAEVIINTAAQRVADHQAEAEKVLAETREQADKLRADGDAAQEHAEQEAKRINDEAAAMVEATRAQVQQEVEAARAQAQQELAQWKANAEREIAERRAAAEAELARQRTVAEQKNAALQAEAQQYSADLRRRAGEQAAAHQQQLIVVQKEIEVRQHALGQLQAALENAEQRLTQTRQKGAATDSEVNQLQQRLGEVREDLTAELARLEAAQRAAESAERHANEVRARVQREAQRVADRAAAAVMAAAAIGEETGEYRMVAVQPDANRAADEATDRTPDEPTDRTPDEPTEQADGEVVPEQRTPNGDNRHAVDNGHARRDVTNAFPVQRGPQPQHAAADAE